MWIAARLLKPKMLIGSMIDDEVDDHLDSALIRLMHELDEIAARAVSGINRIVVGDVVTIVAIGRPVERRQPDCFDTDRIEIIESPDQAFEIADSIAVGVHEGLDVQTVDDGVFVPEILNHGLRSHCRASSS